MTDCIREPAREIPIRDHADVVVIGGSCTGVFAAVRAARMGCSVILCEEMNALGGTAVLGLVNIWHTLRDIQDKNQIIAGLTQEMLERLDRQGALTVSRSRSSTYNFNPNELAIELDALAAENRIRIRLHTRVCQVIAEENRIRAVLIEDGDGRGAITGGFFIDCSGDGDVAGYLGLEAYTHPYIQPPTACFHLLGDMTGVPLDKLIHEHGAAFGLEDDWGWYTFVSGCDGITMRADNHIFGLRCDRAADLTEAEQIGRRQMRALVSLLRQYGRKDTRYALTNIPASLGIRESVHYRTRFQAQELALLTGTRYDAPICNGTYPTDIHHADNMAITFRYLDGTETTIWGKNTRTEQGNWRERCGITTPPADYYQVPFDVLVQERWQNFLCAGRMLHADMGAYGALRVMVNLNQLGEAAGCAAACCLDASQSIQALDGRTVTAALRKGGSAL